MYFYNYKDYKLSLNNSNLTETNSIYCMYQPHSGCKCHLFLIDKRLILVFLFNIKVLLQLKNNFETFIPFLEPSLKGQCFFLSVHGGTSQKYGSHCTIVILN